MSFIYVVIETSPAFGRVMYPSAYKTYDEVLAAIKTRLKKCEGFLITDYNDGRGPSGSKTIEEKLDWAIGGAFRFARDGGTVEHIRIDKKTDIEIHKLPVAE